MTPSPLDLPQVWQRPSFDAFVATLNDLQRSPPAWNAGSRGSEKGVDERLPLDRHGDGDMMRYLSTIVKCPLGWLADDEREQVWELASKRMTERCGRSAMGDMTRLWHFPGSHGDGGGESTGEQRHRHGRGHENEDVDDEHLHINAPFELAVREPALTGDSLGLKTWGSSYVLARHLPRLAATSLRGLLDGPPRTTPPSVLELGSGTGLLGLAAAALWKVPVALSDLPNIVPNLKHNADKNASLVEAKGGSLTVGPLTWGGSEDEVDQDLFAAPFQFKIVLVADPLYDDDHPRLLATAIEQHLALGDSSRAVVMVPLRDPATVCLLESFRKAVQDLETPLFCVQEDELAGQDDWTGDADGGRVRCWLGIFSRAQPPST
ncbi:hypothetical protein RJ55_08390 [Drechmeria coniospora]|nr:hypothetical protein RJ55_08390 [Drechmeria coniospora]